jgi:transposase-like protein
MKEVNPEPLDGTVEIDETYVGGKKLGQGVYAARKAKEVVIGIKQRNGELRFFHAEDATSGTLAKYIRENIRDDVDVIMTDEFAAYPLAIAKAEKWGVEHKTVNHSKGIYANGDITTNGIESAFSLLKRVLWEPGTV